MIAFLLRAYPLFGTLTELDCTNEDHCPAICFRVGRMHWQPAERRNEANCRRPTRPAHGRNVRRYRDGGHGDLSRGRGWRGLGRRREHPRVRRDLALLRSCVSFTMWTGGAYRPFLQRWRPGILMARCPRCLSDWRV